MTVAAAAQRCRAAGLDVQAAAVVGTQVCVTVRKVPQSAGGLQALAQRLGVGSMTVAFGNGRGNVTLWLMRDAK